MSANKVVVTGVGILSSAGDSVEQHLEALKNAAPKKGAEEYKLAGVKAAKYLSDKRMLKVVSKTDSYGLIGVENAKKDAAYENGMHDTWRLGVYIGAPAATAWNNENYFDAVRESAGSDGAPRESEFGKTCMNARPTTLLLGLPNNVLCYAAIILDAKGPNSNYTSCETSGHLAVLNATRRIQSGRIDAAVGGGFSAHTEPVVENMLVQNGITKRQVTDSGSGTTLADGSVFFILEDQEKAAARGARVHAEIVGGAISNEGQSGFLRIGENPKLINAMTRCLNDAGVKASEVGLVLTSGTGLDLLDQAERKAVDVVFNDLSEKPAVGSLGKITGNLMEAGGLQEVVLAPKLFSEGKLPESMQVSEGCSNKIDSSKPYTLITRGSMFGNWSCLLVKNP
jgi:3-oxoacyl-[acyl-carrier-protein] synthase II